jgi:hypothetical protein
VSTDRAREDCRTHTVGRFHESPVRFCVDRCGDRVQGVGMTTTSKTTKQAAADAKREEQRRAVDAAVAQALATGNLAGFAPSGRRPRR